MHFLTINYIEQVYPFTDFVEYQRWCMDHSVFGLNFKEFCCCRGFVEQMNLKNISSEEILDIANGIIRNNNGTIDYPTKGSCGGCGGGHII